MDEPRLLLAEESRPFYIGVDGVCAQINGSERAQAEHREQNPGHEANPADDGKESSIQPGSLLDTWHKFDQGSFPPYRPPV